MRIYSLILFMILFLSSCSFTNERSSKSVFFNSSKITTINDGYYSKYSNFKDWYVLSNAEGKCALVSYPVSSYGDYFEREIHYFYLTYNKNIKAYEIAVIGGANYSDNSFSSLMIEDYVFMLPAKDNQAWSNNETMLISTLLKSTNNWFFLENEFNNYKITDKYSLAGFAQAFKKFNNTCL